MCQKFQALIRRRAERTASEQSLFFLFLCKPAFPYIFAFTLNKTITDIFEARQYVTT